MALKIISISNDPNVVRTARLWRLKKKVNLYEGVQRIRRDIDPGKVLGAGTIELLKTQGIIFCDEYKMNRINVEKLEKFLYFLYEEGGIGGILRKLKGGGFKLRVGEDVYGSSAIIENIKTAIIGRLIDEVNLTSKYGILHHRVVEAIGYLVAGKISEWNNIKNIIDFIMDPFLEKFTIIDLSWSYFINEKFNKANFAKVDFSRATFINTEFKGSDFPDANLYQAVIMNSSFTGAYMHGVNLDRAELIETDMSNTKLPFASICNSHLQSTSFQGAHLIRTNFEGSNFLDVIFSGADFTKAKIERKWEQFIMESGAKGISEIDWI